MMTERLTRRMAMVASAAALIGMGMLTSCGAKEKPTETAPSAPVSSATAPAAEPTQKAPETSSSASSPSSSASAPTVEPTEKAITPAPPHSGSGPNSYAPTERARPAPTALPGNVITGG